MINERKYDRKVELQCPTCGGKQFESEENVESIKCATCGLLTTKDELIAANSELVEAQVKEQTAAVLKDVEKSFKNLFKSKKF